MRVALSADETRRFIVGYYEAYLAQDTERLRTYFADDVAWWVRGPVHILPFFGERRGREAVIEAYDQIHRLAILKTLSPRFLVVEDDKVSSLFDVTGTQRMSGRVFSFQIAHFFRLRDGEIVEYRALLDSFDVVEQALGRQIDVAAGRDLGFD